MSNQVVVRDLCASDESAWRDLWAGYNRFYKASVPPEVTVRTWERLLDPATALFCRVAELDGRVIGFSNSVLHDGTWVIGKICYLEDLFVDSERRGNGVGRALIGDLVTLGRERGWARLYWHTARDNPARGLYDKFIGADDFVRYQMSL
ncbi:GNAT family N-acetyltransferase [Acetobacter conturbans]|uniref:GNAT family N-acetyltransferase n=1 Tax=Acetobacter conturbans TaxID=1737472 RepID=A0ABX0JZ68_9PROT|nr:GNAT family N-acetyltransferase [Acetobacter conturbans]NHN87097.1 GNAT family N-acetyltransferase [Acetobacter conturbans]